MLSNQFPFSDGVRELEPSLKDFHGSKRANNPCFNELFAMFSALGADSQLKYKLNAKRPIKHSDFALSLSFSMHAIQRPSFRTRSLGQRCKLGL
jgi:hypothetical protein